MGMLRARWVKPRSLVRCWTWSQTGEWYKQSLSAGTYPEVYETSCTTTSLLCYLTSAYPDWALGFQFLIALDFSSHYMHMNRCVPCYSHACASLTPNPVASSLVTGSKSHKQVDSDVSRLLRAYYNPVRQPCARSQ